MFSTVVIIMGNLQEVYFNSCLKNGIKKKKKDWWMKVKRKKTSKIIQSVKKKTK